MTKQRIDVYEKVTNAIIEEMEKGHIPWEKEWSLAGAPKNRVSNRPYSGINFVILSFSHYECNQWLTYKQAKEMGGSVKKGEKGSGIVFFKPLRKKESNGDESRFFVLKSYTVFNVEQCEGIEPRETTKTELCGPLAYTHHIEAMRRRNNIRVEHGNPAYLTVSDYVKLPTMQEFDSEIAYCQTAAHEFVHWTGNSSRHDRFKQFDEILSTSNELYASEELVAEIGACIICSGIGIDSITHHAAYLQSWLRALKNDKKYIFKAAAKAQKAVDLLTGFSREDEEEEQKSA